MLSLERNSVLTSKHFHENPLSLLTFSPKVQMLLSLIQETVPTPDDMVAVLNLLDHMTSLLDLELEAERGSSSEATAAVEAAAETNGGGEPNLDSLPMVDRKMPCLDLLLSENILSHILATSRMPVSLVDVCLGAHFPIGMQMGRGIFLEKKA